jgi:Kef-type K+ transport system membrane component KefB
VRVSVTDPVSSLGLAVATILVAAKIGGHLAVRAKQPSVLGELIAGIVLGALPWPFFADLRSDAGVDMLARIGVLVLLFEVGLETTVRDVLGVGVASVRVAVLGTIGTLVAGFAAAMIAMPGASILARAFVAAAITATSIGISARVLKDAGVSRTKEATTILSAAVLDDVLGLVVLAVISGIAVSARGASVVTPGSVAILVGKTVGFLLVAIVLGVKLSPTLFRHSARLRSEGALLAAGLALCFGFAWASDVIGLAPIVGAFTAGLILDESHSARFVERGERSLSERIEPISSLLVPIFFVMMGMRADLGALFDPRTLALVGALSIAAIAGKLACALGTPRGADRLTVALGMVPRGEVSLVFANLGVTLEVGGAPLLDAKAYSALVTVVIVTTLVTPIALERRIRALKQHEPALGTTG